jgi:enediyne biosynthesis protein E3
MLALGAQGQAYKDPEGLDGHLSGIDPEFVGFAVEGASMGLFMRREKHGDAASLAAFQAGPWGRYGALIYAGIGLGLGEFNLPVAPAVEAADDLMAAFIVDGYAFHFGFIEPAAHLNGQPWPDGIDGDVGRVFDVGLARSLWFGRAGAASLVASSVTAFDEARHEDLWAGIGFAATYAGGLSESDVAVLFDAAGPHRAVLAAGSALAAHVRVHSGNLVPTTESNCLALAGRSAGDADALCIAAQSAAGGDTSLSGFLKWRGAIAGG